MAEQLHEIYLAFGANLGDRAATLRAARARLSPVVEVVRCSRVYETQPWGDQNQPAFLNAVCHGRTSLSPSQLLAYLKTIEHELGRVQTRRWGPRVIDLDILFFDDLVLNVPYLTIPHPLLHQRAFVLQPLHEIAPALQHPALHMSVAELAARLVPDGVAILGETWH